MAGVYRPAEDSMLLLRHAQAMVSGSVLDMGTGSGILAIAAAQKSEVRRVVAVDIDPDAINHAMSKAEEFGVSGRIEFRVGDLFEGMAGDVFDWILFNPPYLPSEGPANEVSWSGEEGGHEVIRRFLDTADRHLNLGGTILLVFSSRTGLDIDEVEEKYSVTVLEELPLFFERLYCLLLRPLNLSEGPGRTRR